MQKRVVIITGSELRHTFFRMFMALPENADVIASYCEGMEKNIQSIVAKEADNPKRKRLLDAREQSEKDFFALFCSNAKDFSKPKFIKKGEINEPNIVQEIISLKPDILITYGSSIIKEELINAFRGRFINIHLGLSPYYRGAGTNFWPFVNDELEYVGTTFMHIDEGVDTGGIIHQIRARFYPGDSVHSAGNRLIRDSAEVCVEIVKNFDKLGEPKSLPSNGTEKYYRNKDFTEESAEKAEKNLSSGMINRYFEQMEEKIKDAPIVSNPAIK